MKPLLSITIPTYNRPNNLKGLYLKFLSKISYKFDYEIEIIICDNSDSDCAAINKEVFKNSKVKYMKNQSNIGYSGNLIRCLKEAKGEYVWVVSDDDTVDLEAFNRFMGWLKNKDTRDVDAIMLPFQNGESRLNQRQVINTFKEWRSSKSGIQLHQMVKNSLNIPFILFSSVIVKNDCVKSHNILDSVQNKFLNNDFIQIPLFSELIGKHGWVEFYTESLQQYQPPKYVRFAMFRMVKSLEEVLRHMTSFFSLSEMEYESIYLQGCYRRWMRWLIQDRVGVLKVKDAKEVRWLLIRKWWFMHFNNLINTRLFLLNIMPVFLLKKIYKLKKI
jgi:glycosyltransferase involved in cell wall biosynthesis